MLKKYLVNVHITHLFYFVLAGLGVFFYSHLAFSCFFSDSEIWLMTLSQDLSDYAKKPSLVYKATFHAITWLFGSLTPSSLLTYFWSRLGWLLTSILCVYTWHMALKKHFAQSAPFLFTLFICICFNLFLNQGFRIRADLLCSLFLALNLIWAQTISHRLLKSVAILATTCFLLLSTPKSIYFISLQWWLLVKLSPNNNLRRDMHRTHLSLFLMGTLSVLLVSFLYPSAHGVLNQITNVADFFLKTFNAKIGGPHYFSIQSFYYLKESVIRSPIHYLIFSFTLWTLQRKSFLLNLFIGCLATALFHNHKLPFFLLSCFLPLCVLGSFCIYDFFQRRKRAFLYHIALSAVLCFFSYNFYLVNKIYNNNTSQIEAVATLEQLLSTSDHIYFDVVGSLPKNHQVPVFTGPGEASRKLKVINDIARYNPSLILQTYKTSYLEPEFITFLEANYLSPHPGVWLKATHFSPSSHPKHFKSPLTIMGKQYWLLPYRHKNHLVFDTDLKRDITQEVLSLDTNKQIVHNNAPPSYLAVPITSIFIGVTKWKAPWLNKHPRELFRHDTGF